MGLWAVSPEAYAWLRGYLTVTGSASCSPRRPASDRPLRTAEPPRPQLRHPRPARARRVRPPPAPTPRPRASANTCARGSSPSPQAWPASGRSLVLRVNRRADAQVSALAAIGLVSASGSRRCCLASERNAGKRNGASIGDVCASRSATSRGRAWPRKRAVQRRTRMLRSSRRTVQARSLIGPTSMSGSARTVRPAQSARKPSCAADSSSPCGFRGHPGASRNRRRLARPERCRESGGEKALRRHPLLDNPQPMPLTRVKTSPCPVQPRPAGRPELDAREHPSERLSLAMAPAVISPAGRAGQVPGQVDGTLTRFTPVKPERRDYIRHICVRNADPQNDAVEALRHGHDCPSRCIRERETYTDVSRCASGTPLM